MILFYLQIQDEYWQHQLNRIKMRRLFRGRLSRSRSKGGLIGKNFFYWIKINIRIWPLTPPRLFAKIANFFLQDLKEPISEKVHVNYQELSFNPQSGAPNKIHESKISFVCLIGSHWAINFCNLWTLMNTKSIEILISRKNWFIKIN